MRGSIFPVEELFDKLPSIDQNCFRRGMIPIPSSFSNSYQCSFNSGRRGGTEASVLVNKALHGVEERYPQIEKLAFALIWP
jgi:hypothetical protein